MQFAVKLFISLAIIFFCTYVAKKLPSMAGLIATMPLTGSIVLVWIYFENRKNYEILEKYTRGALWGIVPSILFFLTAFFFIQKADVFSSHSGDFFWGMVLRSFSASMPAQVRMFLLILIDWR